jgi:hypothetical protein
VMKTDDPAYAPKIQDVRAVASFWWITYQLTATQT